MPIQLTDELLQALAKDLDKDLQRVSNDNCLDDSGSYSQHLSKARVAIIVKYLKKTLHLNDYNDM
jgi:hypothetical protein